MTLTEDVVTDLLPVYFSGEASADTRHIVEDFFRDHPAFERLARRAATPVDRLRHAPAVTADAAGEMTAFKAARREIRRARLWFSLALLFTCLPLSFVVVLGSGSGARVTWLMLRDEPWQAVMCWAYAAFCWWMYLRRRQS